MTPEAAFEAWWKWWPERFGHQKNHAKVGWLAGWKQGRAEEREACAMVAEAADVKKFSCARLNHTHCGCKIAAAIRGRVG